MARDPESLLNKANQFKNQMALLATPGVWAIPEAMLTVIKRSATHVEIASMPEAPIPDHIDPKLWPAYQRLYAAELRIYSELAGFETINKLEEQA